MNGSARHHPLLDASFTLYESSFPPNERRTRDRSPARAAGRGLFCRSARWRTDRLLADVFLWETEDFCLS
ncbi:MAG: hypothetical protein ACLU3I_17780 [Acutalibacteraceae bacterium]